MSCSTKSLRILLVEDHPDSSKMLARLLAAEGHVIREARSGTEALHRAGGERFDMTICDLGLPDIGGMDLVKTLRERHDLPAIIVSGYGDELTPAECKALGFLCCLKKPLKMDDLKKVLAAL
jgi:CheY-like chemotaxis protein